MYASYFKMSKHSAILSLLQCGNTLHHIVVVVSGAFSFTSVSIGLHIKRQQ